MNTRNFIEIKATALPVESPGEVVECVNLRPCSGACGPALTPVALPETIIAQGGWRPVCELPENNGVTLLLTDSANRLAVLCPPATSPVIVADTGGNGSAAVMCAVSAGEGKCIVMTSLKPITLSRRGGVWQKDNETLLSGVPVFEAEPLQPVSETVTGLRLASTDNLREGISAKDMTAVTKAAVAAFGRLERIVAASGAAISPIAAAWRICDGEGKVRESSLPVMAGELLSEITAAAPIEDDGSVGALTFTVTPSRLKVSVPPLADASAPAEVELLASAARTPSTPLVTCRIDNPAGARPVLKVSIFPAGAPATEDLLSLRKVATVRGAAGSRVTAALPNASAGDQPAAIPAIAPGGFVAGCVARHGDVTLWGDITPPHRPVFPLSLIAVSFDPSEPWSGAVRVTLADGSKGVFLSGDTGYAPRALSPLICFPHRDAVTLEAWVNTAGGGIKSIGPVTLTPAPEGDFAYTVASGFKPLEFGAPHSPMPVEEAEFPVRTPERGRILCAPAANPLAPVSQADCGAARIFALATSPRSHSSWQFGCGHLYAFTSEGVWGVGISASPGRKLNVATLSRGSVRSAAHVTEAGDYAAALISGGREVMAMSGASAKSISTPLSGTKFNGLGFIPASGTLLLRHGEGNLLALTPSRRDCHTVALPFAPEFLFTSSEALYLGDSEALMALTASSLPAGSTSVKWRAYLTPPPGRRLNRLTVMMSCSDCDLTLTLSAAGHPGAYASHPSAVFHISGAVRHPFVSTLLLPRRPVVEIELGGSVSPDFMFHKIILQ